MPQKIRILERASGNYVEAQFHEQVSVAQLVQAEGQWKRYRIAAKNRLLAAGRTERDIGGMLPQHLHWDWALKSACLNGDPLGLQCHGIEIDGAWQPESGHAA